MKDLPGRTSTYAEDFSSTRAFRALHAPIEYRGAKTSSSSSSSTLVHLSLGEKNQVKKISTRATNRRTSERLKRNPSTYEASLKSVPSLTEFRKTVLSKHTNKRQNQAKSPFVHSTTQSLRRPFVPSNPTQAKATIERKIIDIPPESQPASRKPKPGPQANNNNTRRWQHGSACEAKSLLQRNSVYMHAPMTGQIVANRQFTQELIRRSIAHR